MDKELQEAYFATNYSQEVIQEIGPVSGAILAGLVTLSLYKSLKKLKFSLYKRKYVKKFLEKKCSNKDGNLYDICIESGWLKFLETTVKELQVKKKGTEGLKKRIIEDNIDYLKRYAIHSKAIIASIK